MNFNNVDGNVIKLEFGEIEIELDYRYCRFDCNVSLEFHVTHEHPEYYCSYEWGTTDTLEDAFVLYDKFVSDMKEKIESGEMDEWKR